jgi:acyl-CoA synthetase (AMP-forming)/AMP-acid ligase II
MGFVGLGFKAPGADSDGPRVSPGPHTIVIDEDGKKAAPGVAGRLGRGVYIPQGYYKDPVKTAALFQEVDGVKYAFSGDWARYEEDGTVTLLGRGNTSINTGGEKVYPEEVEVALKSHPDVFDAIVVGVPDDRLGQRVAAIIQVREGHSLDLAALDAHLRTLVAGYKVPRSIWLVEQVGRTVSGKQDYTWAQRFVAEQPPVAAA